MASSVGSCIFIIQALVLVSILVLLLLRHFLPLRTTPSYLIVPIFLALALPASIILLVPVDLASSARAEDEASKGIWLPERAMLVSWRISYWLTFVLTWFILPLLGEYMDSGFRDPKQRILYSLRSNGRYQLIVLGCAIAGLIYISISKGFNFTAIKGLIMALAYVWGLVLAIYLMGHGLVAVPRRMFRNADLSGKLRRLQAHAPRVNEKLEDAIFNLEELEGQVAALKQRKSGTARDYQDWIDELYETARLTESRITASPAVRDAATEVPAVITERYLADLTRRLNRARHQRARYIEEWDRVVQEASETETILDSKASKRLSFGRSSPQSSWLHRVSFLSPYLRYHLYVHIFPAVRILFAALFTLSSLAITWSELIKFPAPQLSAVSLTVIHHPNNRDYQIGFGGQIIAAAWICYMCACALSSINEVPVWNQRGLVRRHTYAESACWYAGQIAKLTIPLSYNFLTFLPKHIHESTTFYNFLGRLINLTPLGTGFDYLFPIFILLPVCATLFNLYGRIKNVFGFGIIDDDDDANENSTSGSGGWREGRDLIARDLAGHNAGGRAGGGFRDTSLGLTDSTRPSLDHQQRPAARSAAPTMRVPPTERSPTRQPAQHARPQPEGRLRRQERGLQLDAGPDDGDGDDNENFFTLFGKRVKNTFETIDTPRWMQPSSAPNSSPLFKKPRWMGGDDPNGGSGSSGGGFGRLFGGVGTGGGGRDDGRLRL
ncbi:hypothetical protein GJ744_008196 [Endocarpon pusillum]|uniref:Uncharacterized protein n=1 Tax=Endocarpon pusillum TaxID=364733 RepID=A0A8H7ALU1_9EURO|nr:hypothetical protein GJ744_008196 [Endocarpon pusillum]